MAVNLKSVIMWIFVAEAPLDWLIERERAVAQSIFNVISVVALCISIFFAISRQFDEHQQKCAATLFVVIAYGLMGIAYFCCRKYLDKRALTDSQFHRWVFMIVFAFTAVGHYTHTMGSQPVERARANVLSVVLMPSIPVVLGLPMRHCMTLCGWSLLHVILSTIAAMAAHYDVFKIRFYFVTIAVHMIYLCIGRQQHVFLRKLYDTEERLRLEKKVSQVLVSELEAEKQASADILSMVCDASVWLGSDGDTVIRSDPRFDTIIGRSMLNECLSSFMLVEEKKRYWSTILTCSPTCALPVRSLTTTFMSQSSEGKVDVDLFIAGRRQVMEDLSACNDSPRYLIGFRLNSFLEPDSSSALKIGDIFTPNAVGILPQKSGQGASGLLGKSTFTRQIAWSGCEISDSSDSEIDTMSMASRRSSFRSVRRRVIEADKGHCGPLLGSPFIQSGRYLRDGSESLLEDLIASWNFNLQGCCWRHACFAKLESIIEEMKTRHNCRNPWPVDAQWQCQSCSAVHGDQHPSDSCWICSEPRPGADISF